MTHEERMEALEAGRILQSEVFREAFTCLDARYVKAWRTCTDAVKREDWWYMQRALQEVRRELFSLLQGAAAGEKGEDDVLNAALERAREKP